MLLLLTIAAAAIATLLITSALSAARDPLRLDPTPPGRWGLINRKRVRQRPLSAHERRWQTHLRKAESDEATWRDLVSNLQELESTLGGNGDIDASPPSRFDRRHLRDAIARLDQLAEAKQESLPSRGHTSPNGSPVASEKPSSMPGGNSE